MNDGDVFHIGCYTAANGGQGQGISLARRDRRTGGLVAAGVAAVTDSPSFLAYHPRLPVLYAVGELAEGELTAWDVGPDGQLSAIGRQPTGGAHPCHVAVAPDGRWVASANYGSGSVCVHPLGPRGVVGPRSGLAAHQGAGRPGQDPRRQSSAHAHMVSWLDQDRVVCVDLGTDEVIEYMIDAGRLRVHGTPLRASPGVGPRHLAVGPEHWWYVAGELDGSLCAYLRDPDSGRLRLRQRLAASAQSEPARPSEIAVSPDGRYLYLANRGPDSIAVFALEAGVPRFVAEVSCGGKWPRHFTLHGDFLYVANERSHAVVTFRISSTTGLPEPVGAVLEVPSPTCVVSLKARR